jgi:hypothetical protein
MATLKKLTRMGADVRQIARLLQAKAPEGHMLAYITPDEAKLLKSQGGSGKEHEDTGVPSFEVDDYYSAPISTSSYENIYESPEVSGFGGIGGYEGYGKAQTSPYINPPPDRIPLNPQGDVISRTTGETIDASAVGADRFPSVATPQADFAGQSRIGEGQAEIPYMPSGAFPAGAYAPPEGGAGRGYEPYQIDTSKDTSTTIGQKYRDLAKGLGVTEDQLGKLGLAGVGTLYNAYQTNKAQREAEAAKKEQQSLGAPYQTKGAELQRQAQAGELTPAGQQQLQAVQAQAAQASSSRGGVGAQQSQAQIEALRSQLLQQQYDYGLKLSGIGDQIALGAIKTGLEADRYVQSLNSSFYNNMMYMLGGMQPPAQAQQRTS